MHRFLSVLLLAGLGLPSLARADDPDLPAALALQRTMQKVIAQVEPGIACILVSRSNAYPRPNDAAPGRLGTFDPNSIQPGPGQSKDEADALRKKLDMAGPGYVPQSFGSGVVIDEKGLILTAYHVVQDATRVFVRLPGGRASYADVHAADPRSDLAVLRVLNDAILPLPAVAFGDADGLERGQFILTIANPFAAGFRDGQPSASWGIVSNLRRRAAAAPLKEEERAAKPLHQYSVLIQTDARLHLGSSGGALVNLQGEVVGLTTALAAIQGGETPGGFALPMTRDLRRVVDVLARGEEVEYGFLGVNFQEQAADGAAGIPLHLVVPGSPADVEGRLKPNDVLAAINGRPVRDSDDLFVYLGTKLAGTKVRLEVRRRGRPRPETVEVTLAKLYVPGKKIASSAGGRPFVRGLRVDYSSLLVQTPQRASLRMPAGVLVSEVQPGTAAERALLRPGEIITHVGGRPVTSPAAVYQAVGDRPGSVELTLQGANPAGPPAKVYLK